MFLARMIHALRTWQNFHANVRELEQLSDRQLQDIGLTRGSIREVVRASLIQSIPAVKTTGTDRAPQPRGLATSQA